MADDKKIIEELEKGGKKKIKKRAKSTKKKAPAKTMETKRKEGKDDNYLFTLVIVAVVILGIVGIVFGYTKDKLSEITQGGTEATKQLENEVDSLKKKLADMQEKADNLEKESESNKEVVIDLFDKNRSLPTNVDASNWNYLDVDDLSFAVSYPQTWEMVRPIIEMEEDEGETTEPKTEMIYLQPIGQDEYINAITIKSDYSDFANIALAQKVEIFSELNLIDSVDFPFGKMMYFINLDQENREVPTILILTEDNIYRATFNISDKKKTNYFEYRTDFEKIAATFIQVPIEDDEEMIDEETDEDGEETSTEE